MLKRKINVAIAAASLLLPHAGEAGFNDQMNEMFGSMVNVTAPSGYMDQSRGHLGGGQITVKNKTVSAELVSFDPPRIDAGCGGIDAFAGGFSFISADEFTQLIRSIGSTAPSYAFKLALSNLCPSCSAIMEEIRKAANLANSLARDSCEASQMIVNSIAPKSWSEEGGAIEEKADGIATQLGEWNDTWQASIDQLGKDKASSAKLTEEQLKDLIGNVAWVVMNKQGDNAKKFLDVMNDDSQGMAETIMSLTGTLIVKKAESGDPKAQMDVKSISPLISLRDLMGMKGKVTQSSYWSCAGQTSGEVNFQCLKPTRKDGLAVTPMIELVREVLIGDEVSTGIVTKYVNGAGALTDKEKGFMELSPLHGKRLRDLAVLSPTAAKIYAERAAEKIALDLTSDLINDILTQLRAAAGAHEHPSSSTFLHDLNMLQTAIRHEEQSIAEEIVTENTVTDLYDSLSKVGDASKLAEIANRVAQEQSSGRK